MQVSTKKSLSLKNYSKDQLQPFFVVGILVLLCIIFSIMNPSFMRLENIHSVMLTACVVGIITIGQSCCKMADYFDMSVGMVGALGGLAAAFTMQYTGNAFLAVLAGLATGLVCGALAGFLVSVLNMNAFITTFALQSAYRGVIYIFTDGFPVKMFTEAFNDFTKWGSMKIFGAIQFPIVVMVLLYILVHLFLKYTKLGRSIFLVGGNQNCAHICGINVRAVQIFIFLLCDTLAALAGMLQASRMSSASAFLGETVPMESIAATVVAGVVAGRGNMFVAFAGVMIIYIVKNGLIMIGLPDFYQYIAIGLIMFLAVMVQTERKKA